MPPTFAFSHATSFCGAVWDPVIERMDGETLVWDHLGHGRSPALPRPFDWWHFGADVARKVSEATPPLIGVGHSMGGTALVMAELLRPSTFDYLVLIEPILLPPPFEARDNPVAQRAEKRRERFPSIGAASDGLRSKPPFSSWDPEALAGYLRDGFSPTGHGSEVKLACDPGDEAQIYRTAFAHGAWDRLGEVLVPTLVIAGGDSDTHTEDLTREIASRFPSAGYEIVAGAGHFLPMERPQLIADRTRRLGALASSGVDGRRSSRD